MRPPRILDVVRATKEVAPAHPDVTAWWYAPPRRLAVAGPTRNAGSDGEPDHEIEIAVESAAAAAPDRARIARELSEALRVPRVSVRVYRGADERRALFRLLSH